MGSDAPQPRIPIIEFATGSADLERGTEGWKHLCKRVREACENYGCFEVVYGKIPRKLREETFSSLRELIEVPLENKQKNVNPKPYHSYFGPCSHVSLYEGFGIEDASNYNSVQSFAQLMWPHGHNKFCNAVNTMVKELEELNQMIWLMIIDSYDLGEKMESLMKCKMLLRMMKYMAPPSSVEKKQGLHAHTDKLVNAIVCEDQISGLEIEIEGEWIKAFPSPSSFIFFVGDPLMAWSNGRMKAGRHRVTMSGDKDRYSFGVFPVPVEGTVIKPPEELVDEVEHPRVFKEFEFMDFLFYSFSEAAKPIDSAQQIYAFASQVQPKN
ncbi:Oxoglutarate/iron-dependent dioxygenase [Corchorus capsularis]|uniref:Oxoglutarate/iron-dependent dioxygenase n=1 Tax=Corchorus capsularis TaxID=210143 RepID=A0A1R3G2U8_COCAP|nr:Oxoglutarate/iron-dependent dioxygenase [Corchorus capsularis]